MIALECLACGDRIERQPSVDAELELLTWLDKHRDDCGCLRPDCEDDEHV